MKRIDYIDVAKGIATICVILGHLSVTPKIVVNSVYTFHIPLFFFLSGFVINLDKYLTFKEYFIDKFKKIAIPYFFLSILTWGWIFCVREFPLDLNAYTINKFLGIFICAKDTPYYLSLWFIASLFISQLLFYVLIKKRSRIYIVFEFVLCYILAICISNTYTPGWPWALDTVPMAIVFLGCGYSVKKNLHKLEFLLQKRYLIITGLVSGFCGYFNFIENGRSDLFYQNIGNPILYFLSAFFGIWMIMIVSKMFHKSKVLNYIGKNSLVFYAFHRPIFVPIAMSFLPYLESINHFFLNSIIQTVFVFIVIFVGLTVLSEIINRYFPFLLGKNR